MATAIMRSGLRSALRSGAAAPRLSPVSNRSFSSSSHLDEAGTDYDSILSISKRNRNWCYIGIETCKQKLKGLIIIFC